MPRLFKGSESKLRLLLGKSNVALTDLSITLYTTNLDDAIVVIDGIDVEDNIATIQLAPRAFMGMEDGLINYMVHGKVDGEDYTTTRQSNYMLRSLSYIDESGVAAQTLHITENGEYRITPNSGLYVDIQVDIEDNNGSYAEGYEDGQVEGYGTGYAAGYTSGQTEGYSIGYGEGQVSGYESGYQVGQQEGVEVFVETLPTLYITENGVYDEVNKGVNVDVPLPSILESDTVKVESGQQVEYTPPAEYDAVKKVIVEGLPSAGEKMHIPNGVIFSGSTIEEFPIDNYNWEWYHDGTQAFKDCPNLNVDNILNSIKNKQLDIWNATEMFKGTPVECVEGIDFTKFAYCGSMFYTSDVGEVRNCKGSSGNLLLSTSSGGIYPPFDNSSKRKLKVVDCDWSEVTNNTFFDSNYYFANIKECSLTDFKSGSGIHAVEYSYNGNYTGTSYVWYHPDTTGWNGKNCHPWGFYYNIQNAPQSLQVKLIPTDETIIDTQIIPYKSDNQYYVDYPLFSFFNIEVDGKIIEGATNQFNIDLYYPNPIPFTTYEGNTIINCVYWAFPKTDTYCEWSLADRGIQCEWIKTGNKLSNAFKLAKPAGATTLLSVEIVAPENSTNFKVNNSLTINGTEYLIGRPSAIGVPVTNVISVPADDFDYLDIKYNKYNTSNLMTLTITKVEFN